MPPKKQVDQTVIDPDMVEPVEQTAEASPKKRQASSKKVAAMSYEEAQINLTRLFNVASVLMKSRKKYKESDFVEEAKDLTRLAQKYDMIAMGLSMLAPLFLVLGLFSKVQEMMASREKPANVEKEKQPVINDAVPQPPGLHRVVSG